MINKAGFVLFGVLIFVLAGIYLYPDSGVENITGRAIYGEKIYTLEEAVKRCDELCVPAMGIKVPKDRLKSEYCTTSFYVSENGIINNVNGRKITYYCDYHIGENLTMNEPYDNMGEDCYLGRLYTEDDPSTPDRNEKTLGVECKLNP